MTEFWTGMAADLTSALVYLAIAALFFICLVRCIAPVVNMRRLLRRAIRQIRQGEKSKRSWQEEDFLGKGALYAHWREYLNNLFFADGEFHNPSNVEDFINEDSVIYGPGRAQFADVAPGLMVSLGFLGTLIGMTTGLSGFNMDDSEAVMGTIRQLVPGVRYAFTTSIVGVVASILITLITRAVYGAAKRTLTSFYGAMNEYAGVVSVDPMTQIAIYQQEQTALISRMAENMTGDMAEKVGKGIAVAIAKSYQGLQNSLDEFMTYATREQLRGVDLVVQRFMQQMNASLGGQFEQMGRVLEETAHNQLKMNEDVRRAMDGLSQVSLNIAQAAQLSASMTGKMDEYIGLLSGSARQTQEGYERIAASVEHMEIVSRQQNNYLQSVTRLQAEALKALERFESAGQKFMEVFTQNAQSAAQSMGEAAGAIKQSGDVLAANHKALVGGISQDIDQTYNAFFKSTNEVVEHMGWVIDEVKTSVERLPDTVDGAADLYARQADRLTDALRRAQDALDEAVDRLAQAAYPNR